LFPERLDEYIAEDNPVRVIDVFVDELDLLELGFEGMEPEATGRPAYHPATLLKIYIYGYLNRRLAAEAKQQILALNRHAFIPRCNVRRKSSTQQPRERL
jgi:transposase